MIVMVLSACATTSNTGEGAPVVESPTVVDGDVLPLPEQRKIEVYSLPGGVTQTSVVQRLMSSAQQSRDEGEWEAAANSLERALRIEPRNAVLWGQLADVRFRQANWQQAIQLAAKSNALADNNINLLRQNWVLMANAYDAIGDSDRAQSYRDRL